MHLGNICRWHCKEERPSDLSSTSEACKFSQLFVVRDALWSFFFFFFLLFFLLFFLNVTGKPGYLLNVGLSQIKKKLHLQCVGEIDVVNDYVSYMLTL